MKKTRTISVNVPAGINNGQTISLRGEGDHGIKGGSNGNLNIQISVKPHQLFVRKDNHIYCDIYITLVQACLGCTIEIPTIDGVKAVSYTHLDVYKRQELSFGKIYHYRDCEKVLCCFLPLLGFFDDDAVKHIVGQRLELLYNFTKIKCYDIYVDGAQLKGVKKEWQPFVINPCLLYTSQRGHLLSGFF